MLITLAYLVFKRQKRFKSLEYELERKKTMQGQQTKEQIHKSGMGSFLRSYTSATRPTSSSRSGSQYSSSSLEKKAKVLARLNENDKS